MSQRMHPGRPRAPAPAAGARRLGAAAALGLLLAGLPPAAAQDGEYLLGPQDKVRVRVLEWLPSKGTYQAWEALDGEYAISGSGLVSIPLVGAVEAGGRDTGSLARAIGEAVRGATGLKEPPAVSVEVAQFRPVYVVGAVKTPGEYAWRPELDVVKAIGLAGGRYRPFEGSPRLERDVITQAGVLRSIELEITRTAARQARLAAEVAEVETIAFPERVTGDPAGAQIMEEEQAIFASRRESLARQLAAISELKTFLETEIEALNAKVAVLERQLGSTRTELSNAIDLASRGLSLASRQFSMDRLLGDLQSEQLDLSTAIIRVRQSIAGADREKIGLVEERRLQLVREQQDTQASLDQLEARRHTAERLIFEASVVAPQEAADALVRQELDVAMRLTRTVDGRKILIDATRDTPVLPGDVVEIVEVAPPAPAPGSGLAAAPFGTPTGIPSGTSTGAAPGPAAFEAAPAAAPAAAADPPAAERSSAAAAPFVPPAPTPRSVALTQPGAG